MKGFTLIESVVLIAVTTLALLALVNLFVVFNSLYGYQQAYTRTAGSALVAMSAFESAVLPADAVLASHAFSGTTYTTGTTTLVVELPSIDGSGNVISGTHDYIAFYVTGTTTLARVVSANAGSARSSGTKILTTTLSALALTYSTADVTKATSTIVDIQTQSAFKQQTVSDHLRERLYLRNAP